MKVFAVFFKRRVISKGVNAFFLVFLLKKSVAKEMLDFMPISLVGSLYKIIAKVLSIRLRGTIESMVLNSQNAFVKGR